MKYFAKLNIFSALYALAFLIQIEPMLNFYRISRVTNWSGNTIQLIILLFNLVIFVIATILFFLFSRKYLNTGKLRYLMTLLWVPYIAIFIHIFNSLFPMTDPGDGPAPVLGLILIAISCIYPLYIAFINVISSETEDN